MQGRVTYIVLTKAGEYYCGKTTDLGRRMQEHDKEKKPHWFGYNNRKNIHNIITIKGDFEKQIKRMGVGQVYKLITALAS